VAKVSVSRGVLLDFLDRVIQNWTNQLFRGGYVCFMLVFGQQTNVIIFGT
jgi:hypothetical protein